MSKNYRAQVLAKIDEHFAAADARFDENEGKGGRSLVLCHEANGAMTALKALKLEIQRIPFVAKAGGEDGGDGNDGA